MQRYVIPSAIEFGVLVGALVLFCMALYGTNP